MFAYCSLQHVHTVVSKQYSLVTQNCHRRECKNCPIMKERFNIYILSQHSHESMCDIYYNVSKANMKYTPPPIKVSVLSAERTSKYNGIIKAQETRRESWLSHVCFREMSFHSMSSGELQYSWMTNVKWIFGLV